jgi:formate dehydrogenase maturation protein FdhE
MKKLIFFIALVIAINANAENELPKPYFNFEKVTSFSIAPPASNLAYTALKESPTFQKEFQTLCSQVAQQEYDQTWNNGSQNPNSTEGRRLTFAKLILTADVKTMERLRNQVINTAALSLTLNDDNQFRNELRDYISTNIQLLGGSW